MNINYIVNVNYYYFSLFLYKDIKICEIVGAFQEASQYYGRKIIDELHSSRNNNTDPNDMSPRKYLYGEIFFQFATDYESNYLKKKYIKHI